MDELVKSFRLGVVQIFGIMVPGLVLLASLAYALLGPNHLGWVETIIPDGHTAIEAIAA